MDRQAAETAVSALLPVHNCSPQAGAGSVLPAVGPMNAMPLSSQRAEKSVFSDRKP